MYAKGWVNYLIQLSSLSVGRLTPWGTEEEKKEDERMRPRVGSDHGANRADAANQGSIQSIYNELIDEGVASLESGTSLVEQKHHW